ncbi:MULTISPECIES: RNA ligase family protein [Bacillaceae]|uniref:DNA ligase (ATP) n=1 Tax=Evansella alkalicola TaxID=745819 RepID=A0ABS6JRK1_9BACI|nr:MULTISPECIES: RNA ligase family protein [Bacillaceae]MBU9721175.1 DNA ligase [Bacillus alkalicola]
MKLKLIKPFEPVSADEIPTGDNWISQIKWDGTRILTYYDGDEVRLFNRRKNERTHHFPEISDINDYCSANSIILDGEVIALDKNGKPSFHEVMKRDAIRKLEKVTYIKDDVPVYYIIFDVLYLNGQWIIDRPLRERQEILSKVINPNRNIQLAKSQLDGDTLFEVTKEQDMEGIIVKDLDSPYKLDKKDASWLKVKNYRDIIAVIGGVTYRDDIVNSVLLGLYNEKRQLFFVGHAGTGKMKQEDWANLTKLIKPLLVDERPFINQPERYQNTQWVKPHLTVKIKYIEWPVGRSIRQPSIQAFTDIPPSECTLPGI